MDMCAMTRVPSTIDLKTLNCQGPGGPVCKLLGVNDQFQISRTTILKKAFGLMAESMDGRLNYSPTMIASRKVQVPDSHKGSRKP